MGVCAKMIDEKKCPLINNGKHINEFLTIKTEFERLYIDHNCVPNGECPFIKISVESQKECPCYE